MFIFKFKYMMIDDDHDMMELKRRDMHVISALQVAQYSALCAVLK